MPGAAVARTKRSVRACAALRTVTLLSVTLGAVLAAIPVASAQELVDIGVLKDEEMSVVQDVLFPKKGTFEVGGAVGWMPFDPLVTTPIAQVSLDKHFTEALSLSVLVGGGYGLKTGRYVDLETQPEPLAPYAYRYLASALAGVAWAPIYGKLTATGRSVVHYDVYGAARVGLTIEQSLIPVPAPSFGITGAPTLSLGLGARFFVKKGLAVRAEIRDDLLAEHRELTSRWAFKQNGAVTLGVTAFLGKAGR